MGPGLKQQQTVRILTTRPLKVSWFGLGYQSLSLRGTTGIVRRRCRGLISVRITHPKHGWEGEATLERSELEPT